MSQAIKEKSSTEQYAETNEFLQNFRSGALEGKIERTLYFTRNQHLLLVRYLRLDHIKQGHAFQLKLTIFVTSGPPVEESLFDEDLGRLLVPGERKAKSAKNAKCVKFDDEVKKRAIWKSPIAYVSYGLVVGGLLTMAILGCKKEPTEPQGSLTSLKTPRPLNPLNPSLINEF